METSDPHRITDIARLREILGNPNPITPKKVMSTLDAVSRDFIQRSPFLVIGTSDGHGNLDVSPKGDAPGFVAVEDETTLLIPDRRGNKLLFGFQNILANPHVALIFMLPGTAETLRVNGAAELTCDPAILSRMAARGRPAVLAIRVRIRECFFHCAKAFIRSALWDPRSWSEPMKISFGKMLAPKLGIDAAAAEKIDAAIEQDYKSNL